MDKAELIKNYIEKRIHELGDSIEELEKSELLSVKLMADCLNSTRREMMALRFPVCAL